MTNLQIFLIELHILVAFIFGYYLGKKDGKNNKTN
jgi:uncharacterized protein YneF (UPF0154 family)